MSIHRGGVKEIVPPDLHHLRAAQGWLELGNPAEAVIELRRVAQELHTHPDVIEVRLLISIQAQQWENCVELAGALIALAPGRLDAWIHRSYALHELRRTQEAFDLLLPVAERAGSVWTVPYNLACYCAQLGRLAESRDWLQQALRLDTAQVKAVALRDPDLKPLWDGLRGAPWDPGT